MNMSRCDEEILQVRSPSASYSSNWLAPFRVLYSINQMDLVLQTPVDVSYYFSLLTGFSNWDVSRGWSVDAV
jgi:hypothetical protein